MGLFPQFQRRLLIPRRQRKKKRWESSRHSSSWVQKAETYFQNQQFFCSLSLFLVWKSLLEHGLHTPCGFPIRDNPNTIRRLQIACALLVFRKARHVVEHERQEKKKQKMAFASSFLVAFSPDHNACLCIRREHAVYERCTDSPSKNGNGAFFPFPHPWDHYEKKKREKEQEHTSLPCSSQSSADCSSHCAEVRSVVFVTLTMKRHHSIILLQASSFSVFFFFFFESSKRSTREKKVQLTPNQQTKKRTGIIFRRKTQKMKESG